MRRLQTLPIAALVLALSLPFAGVSTAQQGSIVLTTIFPSVVVGPTDKVSFTVNVLHTGPQAAPGQSSQPGQFFELVIAEGPRDWEPTLKGRSFSGVRSMYVDSGKSEWVDFLVTPPAGAPKGDYSFLIKALAPGGVELSSLRLIVTVAEKASAGVKLITQYPMLRGPSSNKFVFKIDVSNQAAEDRSYNLSATAPPDWTVLVKPSYEDKQISSISLKANESKTVDLEIQPPPKSPAGEYPVKVQASGGGQSAEQEVKVNLTGTFELALITTSGRLNATATAGQQSSFGMTITNRGSADLSNISVKSSQPDAWEVKSDPDTIENLPAGNERQVQLTVKPSAKALAGDYILSVTASNPQATKSVDIRTTVEAPPAFGFIAGAIVAIVLGGVYLVYRTYGRR